jgi:outer membrane receptor for monomeric catechols
MKHIRGGMISALIYVAVMPAAAFAQTPDADASDGDEISQSQEAFDEIVVTAERRASNVQDTAIAISVRAGSELAKEGKFTTKQVLEDIAGVIATDNNSRNIGSSDVQGNNITIRGVTPGETAGPGFSQISPTPATAVYVDGVYEGVGGAYDLDRVEVLRGPQGTLYGRSATAGVVAFHTRNPTMGEFEANGCNIIPVAQVFQLATLSRSAFRATIMTRTEAFLVKLTEGSASVWAAVRNCCGSRIPTCPFYLLMRMMMTGRFPAAILPPSIRHACLPLCGLELARAAKSRINIGAW